MVQIILNKYPRHHKCYFGFIYYDVVTMATIMTKDNPYPNIRFNSVVFNSKVIPNIRFNSVVFNSKVMVKTFNKSFLIISSTDF